MSTQTRSMIGAQLVGHVEGLLLYGQIAEAGQATARRLVNDWRAELARDLGHGQDNISPAQADELESEIRGLMSGALS